MRYVWIYDEELEKVGFQYISLKFGKNFHFIRLGREDADSASFPLSGYQFGLLVVDRL